MALRLRGTGEAGRRPTEPARKAGLPNPAAARAREGGVMAAPAVRYPRWRWRRGLSAAAGRGALDLYQKDKLLSIPCIRRCVLFRGSLPTHSYRSQAYARVRGALPRAGFSPPEGALATAGGLLVPGQPRGETAGFGADGASVNGVSIKGHLLGCDG